MQTNDCDPGATRIQMPATSEHTQPTKRNSFTGIINPVIALETQNRMPTLQQQNATHNTFGKCK